MARIILKQTFAFTDKSGSKETFYADPSSQSVPDWVTSTPEFDMLKKSEHIEVVEAPIIPVTPVVPQAVQPDAEDMAADANRQVNAHIDDNTPPKAGEEAVLTDALQEERDALAKSSGIDGDAGDWTRTAGAGLTDNTALAPHLLSEDANGKPVPKGSPADVYATEAEKLAYTASKAV